MPDLIAKPVLPSDVLVHILERPGIVGAVQSLEPAVLHRWVTHIGLEDAGELIALASSSQLVELFDRDLWRSESAGVDETFDAERFALWLEVLLDSGVRGVLRKVAELDEDLLTLALCRHTFVIDIEALAQRMSSGQYDEDGEGDPDLLLKELDGALSQEFEQFRVLARSARSWESIRTLLVELDAAEPELFVRLLERCCHISLEHIEDNGGLYEVLSSGELVETDVAAEREERRTKQGYVAPSAARSFLAHARVEPMATLLESDAVDPMTHAYFRDAEPRRVSRARDSDTSAETSARTRELLEALEQADVITSTPALPLLATGGERGTGELSLVHAVRALRAEHESAHTARVHELAYLANVLLAACSSSVDELRAVDAAQAALAICELGCERLWAALDETARARALACWLRKHSLVKLFRIGWQLLTMDAAAKRSDATVVRALLAKLSVD